MSYARYTWSITHFHIQIFTDSWANKLSFSSDSKQIITFPFAFDLLPNPK